MIAYIYSLASDKRSKELLLITWREHTTSFDLCEKTLREDTASFDL